jgi:hypothetical protein
MKFRILLVGLVFFLFSPGATHAQAVPDAVLSSDNPADHALAQLLANHLDARIIVTHWGTMSNDSIEELLSLNASRIYIIGGEVAVPRAVKTLAEKGISVEKRFNGTTRYETSARVAREWENSSGIVVAYGYDVEGIKEAMARAESERAPLLFVPQSHIPSEVNETINLISPQKAILFPAPDMIENLLYADLNYHGMEIEVVRQDHEEKTFNMISLANITLRESEGTNFTFDAHKEARNVAAKLINESRESLAAAEEMYDAGRYNLAFGQAVLAKFKAEYSIRIRTGIIEIPEEEEPEPEDKDVTIKISQILLQPTEYSEKEVLVKAKVEEAVDVAGKAYVKLFDGTGRIIVTFPADREIMLSRGFIFMADPGIVGKTVMVNGTVYLNVPLGEGEGHGAFAYLIEVNTITLAED